MLCESFVRVFCDSGGAVVHLFVAVNSPTDAHGTNPVERKG
jgi:hypothetical protein